MMTCLERNQRSLDENRITGDCLNQFDNLIRIYVISMLKYEKFIQMKINYFYHFIWG